MGTECLKFFEQKSAISEKRYTKKHVKKHPSEVQKDPKLSE
jgi:hypothetical protein